jgi:hypothetical protein
MLERDVQPASRMLELKETLRRKMLDSYLKTDVRTRLYDETPLIEVPAKS